MLHPKRMGTEASRLVKENMVVLWADDGKWSYPRLGIERGRVEGPMREKIQTRLGLVRAMKNSYCGWVAFG
jgi:hypothetical protein